MPLAPKTTQYFGGVFLTKNKFSEKYLKEYVHENSIHDSPLNILRFYDQFKSYFQKDLKEYVHENSIHDSPLNIFRF